MWLCAGILNEKILSVEVISERQDHRIKVKHSQKRNEWINWVSASGTRSLAPFTSIKSTDALDSWYHMRTTRKILNFSHCVLNFDWLRKIWFISFCWLSYGSSSVIAMHALTRDRALNNNGAKQMCKIQNRLINHMLNVVGTRRACRMQFISWERNKKPSYQLYHRSLICWPKYD